MSAYKFYYTGSVEISADILQWVVKRIVNDISKYDNTGTLDNDSLYDIFEVDFAKKFDEVCYIYNFDSCIKRHIYKDVKITVLTMVQDDLEKRRQ